MTDIDLSALYGKLVQAAPKLHDDIAEWHVGIRDAETNDEDIWALEIQLTELTDTLTTIIAGAKLNKQAPDYELSSQLEILFENRLIDKALLDAAIELESAIGSFAYHDSSDGVDEARDNFVAALDEWLAQIKQAEATYK